MCVNYREGRTAAEAVVDDIRAKAGRALAVAADVSSEAGAGTLFETAEAERCP